MRKISSSVYLLSFIITLSPLSASADLVPGKILPAPLPKSEVPSSDIDQPPAAAAPAPISPSSPIEKKPILLPQLSKDANMEEVEELYQKLSAIFGEARGKNTIANPVPTTTLGPGQGAIPLQRKEPDLGLDLSAMDASVRPQDDLFRYMNGTWIKNTPMPADKVRYGAFDQLRDKSEKDVQAIIADAAAKTPVQGSDEERIANLYNSFMDSDRVEARGLQPLAGDFSRIDAISSKEGLIAFFAQAQSEGIDSPIELAVDPDDKDNSKYITKLGQSGLGLPDRDYYFNQDETSAKIREAYVQYVATLLKLAGEDRAQEQAKTVFALEESLAKHHWTREENRDAEKTYNKVPISGLADLAGLDWTAYLRAANIRPEESSVIVTQPSYFKGLAQVLNDQPLETWKLYMKARLLDASAPCLPKAFVDASFAFHGHALSGQVEMKPRWKRGVALVNGAVGESVGKLYTEKHFPESSKQKMNQLVENLRSAFAERVQGLEWMGPETKQKALEKLEKFTPKIGYPDRWRDYSGLQTRADDLLGNVRRSNQFDYNRETAKLGKPVDKGEWHMTPQTVNAYYNPSMNEVVFPAAILQAPFFNPNADEAVNYGAIGAVIGHEMSHGFDDQGAKYNGDGMLQDWWTPQDKANFEARIARLVSQYDAFEPLPGQHINGKLTLGENIADFAGLTVAYRAYKRALGGREAPVIAGFTGDQRFFLAFSQVWRTIIREKALRQQISTDPHSPGEYRANGVARNMPEFYKAFNVQEGDKLFLPEEDRARIW